MPPTLKSIMADYTAVQSTINQLELAYFAETGGVEDVLLPLAKTAPLFKRKPQPVSRPQRVFYISSAAAGTGAWPESAHSPEELAGVLRDGMTGQAVKRRLAPGWRAGQGGGGGSSSGGGGAARVSHHKGGGGGGAARASHHKGPKGPSHKKKVWPPGTAPPPKPKAARRSHSGAFDFTGFTIAQLRVSHKRGAPQALAAALAKRREELASAAGGAE